MVIHSEILACAFWVDANNDLCSAPLFLDGSVDDDNMLYVEDWQAMDEMSEAQHEELDKIISILS